MADPIAASELLDANGNLWVGQNAAASPANQVTLGSAASGSAATVAATGTDTNISLNLVPKGTGTVQVNGTPIPLSSGSAAPLTLNTDGAPQGIWPFLANLPFSSTPVEQPGMYLQTTSVFTSFTTSHGGYSIAASPDGKSGLIGGGFYGYLTPISRPHGRSTTWTVGTPIAVIAVASAGYYPQGISYSPDGMSVLVAQTGNGTVMPLTRTSLDATWTLGTAITVGTNPSGIATSSGGLSALVCNYGSGTVTPLTRTALNATWTAGTAITVGTNPYAASISPDELSALVCNYGSGTVTPLTRTSPTGAWTAGTAITVGTNPVAAPMSPDGMSVLIVNKGSGTVTPLTRTTPQGVWTAGTAITVVPYPLFSFIAPNNTMAWVVAGTSATTLTRQNAQSAWVVGPAFATFGSGLNSGALLPDGYSCLIQKFASKTFLAVPLGDDLFYYQNATAQTTTSTTNVNITSFTYVANYTGNVTIRASGTISNNTAADGATIQILNGATVLFSNTFTEPSVGGTPFTFALSNRFAVTQGTVYTINLGHMAVTGGTVSTIVSEFSIEAEK